MKHKKQTRAQIRGKQLEPNCLKAKISTGEYGSDDERCFCYGLKDASIGCLIGKCIECKACVFNLDV